jgi:hypothetical protein
MLKRIFKKSNKKTLRPLTEPEDFLEKLRESFMDFLVDVVVEDFKKKYTPNDLNSENIIAYYFENRKKYDDKLDKYNLSIGQTEGILSDSNFFQTLDNSEKVNKDDMVRVGD